MDQWLPFWNKWKTSITFVLITFGVTWLLNLFMWVRGGLTSSSALALQFQMLIPAAAAMLCKFFLFREQNSPSLNSVPHAKWFVYYYFVLFGLYLAATIVTTFQPDLIQTLSPILLLLSLLGMVLWIIQRIRGKSEFTSIRMAGGKPLIWLILGIGLVAFYAIQTALNWVFKLGTPVNLQQLIPQLATQTLPDQIILLSIGLNTVLIGPFLGILISFGEEYGWRGYLLPELETIGRKKAAFWVGIIWGLWHGPIIWMGYNYPGQPILGTVMMVLYTIVLSYFLSYAVFIANGLWIAAFLHALNNQVLSFANGFIYTPKDNILAFGIGIFGILSFGLIILLLLRSSVWQTPAKMESIE